MMATVTTVIALITAPVVSSCHGFSGKLLIATFLTVAEVAAPVASCSKGKLVLEVNLRDLA